MCTVSWLYQSGGYHLLCNRDEKRTRAIAGPPRWADRGGARYLAPVDGDFGGTWIGVNDHGLGLCLLNGGPGRGERSRGLVIPELIWARSVDDCSFLFAQLDLTAYAPFTLLMLEPGSPAMVSCWDGRRASTDTEALSPLTSSSYEAEAVRRERVREFHRIQPDDVESLRRFHRSHAGSSGAHAPCMHRPDAETVSFSWVSVTEDEIRFRYLPAAPCALAA